MRHLQYLTSSLPPLILLLSQPTLSNPINPPPDQKPLLSIATTPLHTHSITPELYSQFEELSRIVDITYCIGTPSPGISQPFICPSHCGDFPTFQLIQSWNTGPLMSDSCGYIALSHPPAEKRILVAFRGTYSLTNALVDLSTGRQEYRPWPPGNGTSVTSTATLVTSTKAEEGVKPTGWDGGRDGKKCEGCWAHAGFFESWKVASEIVVPVVEDLVERFGQYGYRLELVGHSMGGAVAALAGLEFKERGWDCTVTTFGEPRVGNANLSAYINHRFPPPTYRRITHKSDPVPLLPFSKWGFKHHQTEYYIEKLDLPQSPDDVRMCEGDEDESCAASGNVNMLQLLWSHRDYFNRLGLCVPDGWRRVLDGFLPSPPGWRWFGEHVRGRRKGN
ncbi:Lipase [Dactylella cylindrospora]|nr:Lipase [Dactylella cylindrospora]